MRYGISQWDASDKGIDLIGTVTETSDSNFSHTEQLSQSSEDLMRMDGGRKAGAVKLSAASLEEFSRESESEFKFTHGAGSGFTIDKAEDEVKTNHNWMDKQISSRSEHREYDTPTAAPPTTMAALRNSNPTSNQSLLGDPPSGSQLVLSATNTTLYYSPLSDVTKTVKNWIAPYASDGSPNAAPILYHYLDEVEVDVTASVSKTGYHFNGSSTLHSKSTFTETDIGTNFVYRGLELQEPSSLNNWTETYAPVESHTGGITQLITHTKPAADNTITVPNQGTTTTVEPGGEHHSGTTTLSTYLTVQKPLADFVGEFSTKTGYVSNSATTSSNGGSNEGDYSQSEGSGAGGTQGDGPGAGDGAGDLDSEIARTTAEIEQLMSEGLAKLNRLSLEELRALATGTYHSVYDFELGLFAIKPTAEGRWYIFDQYIEVSPTGETRLDEFGMPFDVYEGRSLWRFAGQLPIELNPDVVKLNKKLKQDLKARMAAKNAGEFTLRLIPFGSLADKVAGENNDSWGYVIFISTGDGLMLGGLVMKAGTQGARIVNGLSIAENLTGAGLAAYHGLGEDGNYGHGGEFLLRLAAAGLGTRGALLEQKLDDLKRIGPRAGNGAGSAANTVGKFWSSSSGDIVIDGASLPGAKGMQVNRRLTPIEMEGLQLAFDREFALIYEIGSGPNGGGGRYLLFSGDKASVWFPVDGNYRWISHTHPAGYANHASINDQNYLRFLQDAGSPQRRSLVIPLDELPFWFTPMIRKYR